MNKTNDASPFEQLATLIRNFCTERNWDQFHTPKDLAIGAVTEASELLELFRFYNDEQSMELLADPVSRKKIAEELADVLFFVLRFADKYDFDLATEFRLKMQKNALKYPVPEFHGKNHKSTHVAE